MSIADNISHKIPYVNFNLHNIQFPLLKFEDVNVNDIRTIIMKLDNSSSMGWDKISPNILKTHINKFSNTIAKLMNHSLSVGKFPDGLKLAKVTPIFKTGDKSDKNNYRPISVLPTISKVLEIVILNQMQNHLNINKIIDKNQFGFQKNCSTLSATINLMEQIYHSVQSKNTTACLAIDLSKAFDCVCHNILQYKLDQIGIRDTALCLISDYLINRSQFVQVNNKMSETLKLKCGVPQGSILGPVLFLIYINDIFSLNFYGSIQLFADDAILVYSAENEKQLMDMMVHDVKILLTFLASHKLAMNFDKTSFIIFKLKNNLESWSTLREITLDGISIKRSDTIVFLGLTISSNLTWTNHIQKLRLKISPMIGVLKRVGKYLNRTTSMNVYFSYIHSHLLYLIPIWGGTSKSNLNKIQILQNKVLKILYGLPLTEPTKNLYSVSILPISKLVDFEFLFLIYKIRIGMLRCNLILPTNLSVTNRSSRHALHYRLPNFTYSLLQDTFFYHGLQLFNEIPQNVKDSSIGAFKNLTKLNLLNEFIHDYDICH